MNVNFEPGCGRSTRVRFKLLPQEKKLKNTKADKASQRHAASKSNRNRAERETIEERLQQELGRDTKPGGINKDKPRHPATR